MKMASVTVTEGALKGGKSTTENGFEYYEFLGIPYAKPPVGELRFKSPQSPEKWEIERDATTINLDNIACQVDFTTGQISGSEDCLYLNVYTPKNFQPGSELLPVIVHIHVGGFISGNGIMKSENGPDYLVEQNVVVVTINYRLGVLGFLSLDIPEASGNMGLKDQIKALEWIQGNIDKFNGDKNNVTVMGISAGSASADYLILSPLAKGLFHKAILRSGSALNHWANNFDVNTLSLKLAKLLGFKESVEDKHAVHNFLLTIPSKQLVGTAFQLSEINVTNRTYFGFVPSVEKDFGNNDAVITVCPYKLFKEGNFNKVPTIRGFCNREGSLMSMMKPNAMKELIDNKRFIDHWPYNVDSNDIDGFNKQLSDAYLGNIKPEDENNKFAVDFFSDMDFAAGICIAGKLSSKKVPVYMYEFSYDGKLNGFKVLYGLMKKGAMHGDDLTYVLRHDLVKSDNEQDAIVRERTTKLFTDFAKTGEPTAGITWPVYTEASRTYLIIDKELSVKTDYEPKKIAIFEQFYEKYEK